MNNGNGSWIIIVVIIAMMAILLTQTDTGTKVLNSKTGEMNTTFDMIEDFADGEQVHLFKSISENE